MFSICCEHNKASLSIRSRLALWSLCSWQCDVIQRDSRTGGDMPRFLTLCVKNSSSPDELPNHNDMVTSTLPPVPWESLAWRWCPVLPLEMPSLVHQKAGKKFSFVPGGSALWARALELDAWCAGAVHSATQENSLPLAFMPTQPNSMLMWKTYLILLPSCILATHHIYHSLLLKNWNNHITQRKVFKLNRLIFVSSS